MSGCGIRLDEQEDIGALTEFEAFSSDAQENTTSNGWITKSGFPYTTAVKTQATYVIDHTSQLSNSDAEKQVGYRVQWREGTSGTWITLVDVRNGVTQDNEWDLRTGFNLVTLSSETEFQVRIQFGQTDEGGTGRIRFSAIKVGKVS